MIDPATHGACDVSDNPRLPSATDVCLMLTSPTVVKHTHTIQLNTAAAVV